MSFSQQSPVLIYASAPFAQINNTQCITSQTFYQPQLLPPQLPQNCIMSLNIEVNISLSAYFSFIKKQIQNKQLENQQQALKQVAKIFVSESEKNTDPIMKVVVACINIICLIMHYKKPINKEIYKSIINIRFIGSLLRIGVHKILAENKSIESSLCYLLQLCYEHRLFDQPKGKGLVDLYKKYAFGLLKSISNNPKVIFNTFKIINFLQSSDLIDSEDYVRYDIIRTIRQRTTTCKGENYLIYELAYKLTLNGDDFDTNAFSLFSELNTSSCSPVNSQAFFKSLLSSRKSLSSSQFSDILQQQLYQQQHKLDSSFYKVMSKQITSMDNMCFLQVLESQFVQVLCQRWNQSVSLNCVVDFVNVIKSVQNKAKLLMLEETVKDQVSVLLPLLSIEEEQEQEEEEEMEEEEEDRGGRGNKLPEGLGVPLLPLPLQIPQRQRQQGQRQRESLTTMKGSPLLNSEL